jgi:O-antigen/teichoic acid export membrane protein
MEPPGEKNASRTMVCAIWGIILLIASFAIFLLLSLVLPYESQIPQIVFCATQLAPIGLSITSLFQRSKSKKRGFVSAKATVGMYLSVVVLFQSTYLFLVTLSMSISPNHY